MMYLYPNLYPKETPNREKDSLCNGQLLLLHKSGRLRGHLTRLPGSGPAYHQVESVVPPDNWVPINGFLQDKER